MENLEWRLVVLGIGLRLMSHLVNIARWRSLIHSQAPGYRTLLVFYGAGLFGNSFLPSGFGGDGVRAALLGRTVSMRQAVFSVGLDRGIGLLALSTLLVIGLCIGLPPGVTITIDWITSSLVLPVTTIVILLGLIAAYWLPSVRKRVRGMFDRLGGNDGQSHRTIGYWLGVLALGYVVSVFSQLLFVAANWVTLQAVGINTGPDAALWLVLAVTASLLFPVSINGLGLQEAAYVMVLGAYGVTSGLAVLAALLTRLAQVLFAILGGAGWLIGVPSSIAMNDSRTI